MKIRFRFLSLWVSEELVKIEIISTSDQNLNMAFLRNEFSKTFKDIFHDDVTYRINSYHMSLIYDLTEK